MALAVGGATAAATAGTRGGLGRHFHCAQTPTSGAGQARSGVYTRPPAKCAGDCWTTESSQAYPATHLTGGQRGHDAEGVSALAAAKCAGRLDCPPSLMGRDFKSRPINLLLSYVGHHVTSNPASGPLTSHVYRPHDAPGYPSAERATTPRP